MEPSNRTYPWNVVAQRAQRASFFLQVSVYLLAGIGAVLAILLTISSTGWTDPSGDLNDPFEYKLFDLSSQDADDMGTIFYSTGSHDSRDESPSDSDEEANEDHVRDRRRDGEDDFAQDIPDDVDTEWLDYFMREIEQASGQLLTGFDLLQQKYDNGEYDSAWSILDVVNQVGDIAGQNLTKFSTYNLDGTPTLNLGALALESVTHDDGSEEELRNPARQVREVEPSFDYFDESEHGGVEHDEQPIYDLLQKVEHEASDFDDESVEKQYRTLHASMEKLTATMTSDGHLDGDYDEDDLQALTAEFWSTFADREIDDLSLVSDGRVEEAQVKPTVFGFEKYATQLELTTDDAAFFSQQIHFEDF